LVSIAESLNWWMAESNLFIRMTHTSHAARLSIHSFIIMPPGRTESHRSCRERLRHSLQSVKARAVAPLLWSRVGYIW
jgi:hypothetical protein